MENKNKTAIVTGSSRGIGKTIALKLAENGYNVVVNYNSNADKANELVDEIKALGVSAIAVKADTSDFSQAQVLVERAMEEFGNVYLLVNNAGITRDGLIARMKENDFDDVININLKGAFNCIRHCTPVMMKQREGRIINISSVSGIMGNAGQVNYSASKAGMIGMTKTVAKELGSRSITCNAIAPGVIDTEMTQVLSDKVKGAMLDSIPLKRFGETEEVAELVVFLASDKASYITGEVIRVDGGMAM